MKATAVIDVGFGDAGKGLITDYLADENSLVVRFNGGANAGHTVVTPDGKRHVFGHIGSGTFKGAPTFLSEHFITNPILCAKEHKELLEFGFNCWPMVDSRSLITLPHDMAINQALETKRNNDRHGSCGVGINETVTRSFFSNDSIINSSCILCEKELKSRVTKIENNYILKRIKELELDANDIIYKARSVMPDFMEACDNLANHIWFKTPIEDFDHIIFEGAQGLLLDEDHHFFPHVTRSKTGLRNVLIFCNDNNITELDVIFVTRSYMTRHGQGPFPTEWKDLKFQDDTNNPNEWQGNLRFGSLDLNLIDEAIYKQKLLSDDYNIQINCHLAMTHLDQYGDANFAKYVAGNLGLPCDTYFSVGPTRNDVERIKKCVLGK